MFCQLNHLLDALMFDLCSTGAGKPRAGGVCKYRAWLSFQACAGLAGEVAASETKVPWPACGACGLWFSPPQIQTQAEQGTTSLQHTWVHSWDTQSEWGVLRLLRHWAQAELRGFRGVRCSGSARNL